MNDHKCREGSDPRRAGWCVQCGHQIRTGLTRPRNLEFERQSLEHATYGVMDPDSRDALWQRMLERSTNLADEYVSDPGDVALDRDRPEEVRQESQDTFNHANWWLEDNPEHPKALIRAESLKWLAAFYAAWSDDD